MSDDDNKIQVKDQENDIQSLPIFVAKTKSSAEWKLITNVVSTIVEEPSFEANAEGIQFRGMDPSHVAMIDLNWPNASFEKYECDKEFKLTLRIEELSKLIKRAKQNNSISISADCLLYTSPSPRDRG